MENEMAELNGVNYITLEEAQAILGKDTVICLESDEIFNAKITPDEKGATKETELWCFELSSGRIRRQDNKFCDGRVVDRGGWSQLCIYEEPGIPEVEGERVVGHVVVQKMGDLVRARKAPGLNGLIIELLPSSYSKNELCGKKECKPAGLTEANPQRIDGQILHFLLEEDFPEEEGMTVADFVKQTTDGRSLSALAKVGLIAAS